MGNPPCYWPCWGRCRQSVGKSTGASENLHICIVTVKTIVKFMDINGACDLY